MKKRLFIIILIIAVVLLFIFLRMNKNKEKVQEKNLQIDEEQSIEENEIIQDSEIVFPYKNDSILQGVTINSATNGKYEEFEVKGVYPYLEKGISVILKHKDASPENIIGYYFEVENGKITYDYSLSEERIDETNVFLHSDNNSSCPMSPQYGVLWKTETPLKEEELEIKVDVRNFSKDQYLNTFFIKIVNNDGQYYIDSIRGTEDITDIDKEMANKSIKYLEDTNLKSVINKNNISVVRLKGKGSVEYRVEDEIAKQIFNYDNGAYQVNIDTKESSGIKDVCVLLTNDLEIIGFDYRIIQ